LGLFASTRFLPGGAAVHCPTLWRGLGIAEEIADMDFQPGQPGRIVLTTSADPLLDLSLSDGAVRLLMLIRSLAGHSRTLVTLTQSLATQLRRHPDTIRKWRDELEAGGYIHYRTDQSSGFTTIMVREAVEPPSRRTRAAAQRDQDAKLAPLPWQSPRLAILKPDPWSTRPWIRPWQESDAGEITCEGGAALRRDIKTRKNFLLLPSAPVPARASEAALRAPPTFRAGNSWEAQPPVRTPAEQVAAMMRAPAQDLIWEEVMTSAKDGRTPALNIGSGYRMPRLASGDATSRRSRPASRHTSTPDAVCGYRFEDPCSTLARPTPQRSS
jgi:hypothetical protein